MLLIKKIGFVGAVGEGRGGGHKNQDVTSDEDWSPLTISLSQ